MSRRTKAKNIYLTNEQLAKELIASQTCGQPTVQLCMYFNMIATHMLGSPKYCGYSHHLHEDMKSAALIKCLKNVHNFKEQYSDCCFNYYTRCCEHAFFEVLGKHYKHINLDKQLKVEYADAIEAFNPKMAQHIRDYNDQ